MTEVRTNSHSEVESYLTCERKHYYGYGLRLQGKYTSEALERGILAHAGLAEYYLNLKIGQPHSVAVAEAIGCVSRLSMTSTAYDAMKIRTQVLLLLAWYFDHYKYDPIEVLEVETDYLIPITDDYSLPVKIDLIYRDLNTHEVVVSDHKVVNDFYDGKKADLYPQLPKYIAGLRTKGIKVDRAEYNQLRHRNTNENKDNPGKRFIRLAVPLSKARILRTVEEQIRAANRIKSLRDRGTEEWGKTVLRNTGACGNCSFQLLCDAELNGRPTADLIEFEYRPKTQRNELNN